MDILKRNQRIKFEKLLIEYEEEDSEITINQVLSKIKKTELEHFHKVVSNHQKMALKIYKDIKENTPALISMIEERVEKLSFLLENLENKRELKQENDISNHIFTKAKIKINSESSEFKNGNYFIDIDLNSKQVEEFKDKVDSRFMNVMLFPIKISFSNNKISFEGNIKHFNSEKNFRNKFNKIMSDNYLSLINSKGNFSDMVSYLQEKKLQREIKKFNLIEILDNKVTIQEKDLTNIISFGKNEIEVKKHHWLNKVVNNINQQEHLKNQKKLSIGNN